MTECREPTEDELIDFMDWLIDRKLPSEQIDMSKVAVMDEPLEYFSEERLGPPTGTGTLPGSAAADGAVDGAAELPCMWWRGRLYVVDLGDVRLVYIST